MVLYTGDGSAFSKMHERITHASLARKLAALKGHAFADAYDERREYPWPVYFVPCDTLVGPATARALGIADEHDLFGGVVPHAFMATKAISHPLVGPQAVAPEGWSPRFADRVRGIVLSGFSVFTVEDARLAGQHLLARGPVRLKPVRATGGHGQSMVMDQSELEIALTALNAAELAQDGLVLEENLSEVITHSVGQVRVAELVASYHGLQRLTSDNNGASVYGGSDLLVVRGDFAALLGLDLDAGARLAVAQALTYDAAATEEFAGFVASRRNYDVAQGCNAHGCRCSGVLEQSWRIGGASGAEIAAIEAFRAEPALQVVRASSVEVYGMNHTPPKHATVHFSGTDPDVGPITKYALVEPYAHTR